MFLVLVGYLSIFLSVQRRLTSYPHRFHSGDTPHLGLWFTCSPNACLNLSTLHRGPNLVSSSGFPAFVHSVVLHRQHSVLDNLSVLVVPVHT